MSSEAEKRAARNYRERIKDELHMREKERRHLQRVAVLSHYSGGEIKCACCGETNLEFLTIDHINGGGSKFRKSKPGTSIYYWLKKSGFPEGHRVLCQNCNAALGHYGYCPHGLARG
jgi:hypothetical protein